MLILIHWWWILLGLLILFFALSWWTPARFRGLRGLRWVPALLALLLIGAAWLPPLLFRGPDFAHRSDAHMTVIFRDHAADFERLLAMVQADSAIGHVYMHELWDSVSPLTPARQRAYERLMKPLHVISITRESQDVVVFRSTTTYTFDRKGWLWSRPSITPVIDTGNTNDSRYLPFFRVHRRIASHWYVYYQASS